ncbi:hypothetical protein ANN_07457 [Periplaneta americana]|uniref:Uncharacterized protein n=1 Tax=Periplaneta americana TaxID=6978 RepID=A0ABQ8T0X9_PERAM|nr:hypothetical protein ANN_07457 [Periplaneta americana]
MAGLCEGGNEPSGSLKAICAAERTAEGPHLWSNGQRVWPRNQVGRESRSGQVTWLTFFPGFSLNPIRANAGMAPRFTQPPIKLSTASFLGVKGSQSVVPTTPPHSSAEQLEEYLVDLWTDPDADMDAQRLKSLPTSKKKSWTVEEEVFRLATTGSSRRIDIIAYSQTTKKGYIIDPTIRIETGSSQPEDVNQEKINIYLPTVDCFKAKYQLEDIEVIGLLIGARGVIPKFFESFRKTFELPQTLTADIITSVLIRSCQILSHHIHSV